MFPRRRRTTLATIGLLALTATILLAWPAHGTRAATIDPLLRGLATGHATTAPGLASPPAQSLDYRRLLAVEEDPHSGELTVHVILHLSAGSADLAAVDGLRIGSRIGDVVTARLPVRSLAQLEALPGVKHVEAAKLHHYTLDMALPDAKVLEVWNGSPAYTGAGVLVGIIDSGIDTTHDDFRNNDGTTRIKAMWDLSGSGTPPPGFTYGVEYRENQINTALTGGGSVAEKDVVGHGTHVSGIAVGNGRASGGQYRGVAFEADVLFARPEVLSDDRIIDSMNYLVGKAQSLGQPIAINMSLGGHAGPHDGTSAYERVIDQLSGPGVVFVVAAGNEGGSWVHDNVTANGGTFNYQIASYTPLGADADGAVVGIWVDGGTSPTVNVANVVTVVPGQFLQVNSNLGRITVDNASQGVDPDNGDKQIIVQIDDGQGTDPAAGIWGITLTGGSGTADAWVYASTMPTRFPDSSQSQSVAMPGTAEKAVTVAATKTRNSWPAIAGTVSYSGSFGDVPVGDRAPFSSIGPTRDGRQKPDLCAPGMAIISCYSKDTSPPSDDNHLLAGSKYFATQGTSMATPLTCGIAALMLEKDATLTADQIRSLLRASARVDGFTGSTWNPRFGAGKVDAEAALALISGGTVANGDIDGDGDPTVLDVVALVDYIVDPSTYPLSPTERQAADVFPPGGGDGQLNASDLARLVAFILLSDVPSARSAASGPARLAVGSPQEENGAWWIPVTVGGDAIGAAQFALTVEKARWLDRDVRLDGVPGVTVAAHAAGDQIRVLVYDAGGPLPRTGATLHLAFEAPPAAHPVLTGALVADPYGFARETRIEADDSLLPAVRFVQAAPNPMTSRTTITYQVGRGIHGQLAVFDVRGRRLRVLSDGLQNEGVHALTWDGRDAEGHFVATGIYFCRLVTAEQSMTRKIVLAR